MWKSYSAKTHISTFNNKDYDKEKMDRYRKMINNIKADYMIDDDKLLEAIDLLKLILDKEVRKLMQKWYHLPKID